MTNTPSPGAILLRAEADESGVFFNFWRVERLTPKGMWIRRGQFITTKPGVFKPWLFEKEKWKSFKTRFVSKTKWEAVSCLVYRKVCHVKHAGYRLQKAKDSLLTAEMWISKHQEPKDIIQAIEDANAEL